MKQLCSAVLVGAMLILGSVVPGVAMMSGGGGFHGGAPGGFHGGSQGGMPGGFHGGFHDGHFPQNGHANVHTRVFIGAPFFVGGPFWWGPEPFYAGSPVVVQSPPPTYIRQAPAYWYYCQNPQGYYPAAPQCWGGWLTVILTA